MTIQALASIFRDPGNAEDFALWPTYVVAQTPDQGVVGERIITTPQTADWWHEQQMTLPEPENDVIAAITLFSDETQMAGNNRVKAHPLIITLGNVALTNRWRPHGHRLVAFLPLVPPSFDVSSEMKTDIMHKALKMILAPLKKASFE